MFGQVYASAIEADTGVLRGHLLAMVYAVFLRVLEKLAHERPPDDSAMRPFLLGTRISPEM